MKQGPGRGLGLWGGAEMTSEWVDWKRPQNSGRRWWELPPLPLWDPSWVFTWCSAEPLPPKQESALKSLGTEGLFLFSSLDTDRDLYISPEEFKPIAEKLTGTRRGWGLGWGAPRHGPQLLGHCVCSEQEGHLEREMMGPDGPGILPALTLSSWRFGRALLAPPEPVLKCKY